MKLNKFNNNNNSNNNNIYQLNISNLEVLIKLRRGIYLFPYRDLTIQ